MKKTVSVVFLVVLIFLVGWGVRAQFNLDELKISDTDGDGLTDFEEQGIYRTDFMNPDTDNDGYMDGDEVHNSYDPNRNGDDMLEKRIEVSIAELRLRYYLGQYEVGNIPVSTGRPGAPTPTGEYTILIKKPLVTYAGATYYYPNTKWNMMFKPGPGGKNNFYIHGAFWHDKFGVAAVSGGCVNVRYEDMEPLYNWADVGTKVNIR